MIKCAAGFPLTPGQNCAKCGAGPSGPCWEHYRQLEKENAELRAMVRQGYDAVNHAFQEISAEAQGHDITAQKHADAVAAFRRGAEALLKEKSGEIITKAKAAVSLQPVT